MPGLSLRARILAGALFWTVGLFTLASVVLTRLVTVHPAAPRAVHGFFESNLLIVFALACMLGGFLQVRRGLSGMHQIQRRLASLHSGHQRRLEGVYPSEVQPLVDDLNVLLEQRDQAVGRAVAKAGDLAHGLKTPLAVLAHEADRAAAAGQPDLADAVREQVDRMRRQVDYHLAHARAAAVGRGAGERTSVRDSAEGLVRALARLHAERGVAIDLRIDPVVAVRVPRPDLDEMFGNLLDNACRWARSRVTVEASAGEGVSIAIDDDGPGIEPALREAVLQRGVRADESGQGHGLGLAIVRDLAEAYGGSIALSRSAAGGLRAVLRLPPAAE
jgi:signal transduction histidine kinase